MRQVLSACFLDFLESFCCQSGTCLEWQKETFPTTSINSEDTGKPVRLKEKHIYVKYMYNCSHLSACKWTRESWVKHWNIISFTHHCLSNTCKNQQKGIKFVMKHKGHSSVLLVLFIAFIKLSVSCHCPAIACTMQYQHTAPFIVLGSTVQTQSYMYW